MAMLEATHLPLSECALRDEEAGDFRIVIETPKGSRNKFSYDPKNGCFELSHVLPEGMLFPYDFGFLPSTLGDDGDPIDVLAMTDAPVPVGCVVRARLVGVIEARQKIDGQRWYRNDRLIAVATHARSHEGISSLKDVRPHVLDDIVAFFVHYNQLRGRSFEALGCHGRKRAHALVKKATKRFRQR